MTDTPHHDEPVRGVRLAVDVGQARVGLAATDPGGILASPVATLRRDNKNLRDVRQIVDEVIERNAVRIYVGDPINLKGKKTASTEDAQDRKSTRLNSSHVAISYAVFSLKKKQITSSRASTTVT